MPGTTRRWVLARHIEGAPSPKDFRLEAQPLGELADGKFLSKVILSSVDPGTRSRLSCVDSYAGAMKIGEGIDGFCVAQVVESRNPNYTVGDLIAAGGGWREHFVSHGRGFIQKIIERPVPLGC